MTGPKGHLGSARKKLYLDHKKDPEAAENDEDAEDEGEGDHGEQVEEGGQVHLQAAAHQDVGDQRGTLVENKQSNMSVRTLYRHCDLSRKRDESTMCMS